MNDVMMVVRFLTFRVKLLLVYVCDITSARKDTEDDGFRA